MFKRLTGFVWVPALLLLSGGALAQDAKDDRARFAPDAEVREAFEPVVRAARPGVVSLHVGGEHRVLGTVVDPRGIVLSKASELVDADALVAVLATGRRVAAELVGVDRANDLAFVKVDAPLLNAVELVDDEPGLGRWLASAGMGKSPDAVGVVSAEARAIDPPQLVMGVILNEDHPRGLHVLAVSQGMGADRAGIQRGDVLMRVGGKKAIAVDQVVERLQQLEEGDTVSVEVLRGGEPKTLTVSLSELEPDPGSRAERMNRMGGALSERRRGFERVLQHDAEVLPEHCGGPVVNLRGEVVGLNIARAGRIATYALPGALLKQKLAAFKAGAFAPKADAGAPGKRAQPVNAEPPAGQAVPK